MIRRISILLVILGSVLLYPRPETRLPILPFPPAGITVKEIAQIERSGAFQVRVTMPKTDNALALEKEENPCSLLITITQNNLLSITQKITSLSRYGEFGYGQIQYYKGGEKFSLSRGDVYLEITGVGPCPVATARGATISIEEDIGNPTNRYLRKLIALWLGFGSLGLGLVGLIACEFKRPIDTNGVRTPREST